MHKIFWIDQLGNIRFLKQTGKSAGVSIIVSTPDESVAKTFGTMDAAQKWIEEKKAAGYASCPWGKLRISE